MRFCEAKYENIPGTRVQSAAGWAKDLIREHSIEIPEVPHKAVAEVSQ